MTSCRAICDKLSCKFNLGVHTFNLWGRSIPWIIQSLGSVHTMDYSIFGVGPYHGLFNLWGRSIPWIIQSLGSVHTMDYSIFGVGPYHGLFNLWGRSIPWIIQSLGSVHTMDYLGLEVN